MPLRYRPLLLFALILAFSVFLRAVTDGPVRSLDGDLLQGRWTVTEFDGREAVVGVNTAKVPWVQVGRTVISGNQGCNDFQGGYSIEDDRIVLDDVASTKIACSDSGIGDAMEIEVVIGEVLAGDRGFQVHLETDLMVWIGHGHEIVFRQELAASSFNRLGGSE